MKTPTIEELAKWLETRTAKSSKHISGKDMEDICAENLRKLDARIKDLQETAFDVVQDMTPALLDYHEANPPFEGSRPDLARLYRVLNKKI